LWQDAIERNGVMGLKDIRAVSFDVGGTLIEPWPSVGHVYAEVAAEFGFRGISPEELTARFFQAWREKGSFDYSRVHWSALVDCTFEGLLPRPAPAGFFPALYERFSSPEVWRLYDDALPVLSELAQRRLKLAVISNWDERLRPLLENLKISRFFDVTIVSHDAGFQKPAPEIFSAALEALQLAPFEVLHIGDSVVEDFQGAISAGMKGLLLRRGKKPTGLHEIGSLVDLL
jgi:putative hydrolase of the HAD superfamily